MAGRRILLGIAVAALFLSGLVACTRPTEKVDEQPADAPASGRPTLRLLKNPLAVPAFSVRDLDGKEIHSTSLHGKVVLANFWATWCLPCRAEIPDLVALQEKYRDQLQIIGISQDEIPVEEIKRFAAQYKINYPIVMYGPELERVFPTVFALPTTFVIDRELKMVQKHVGQLKPAMIELETRALAGLEVDADIELVEADQPVKLENPASVTSIPGVDLTRLTAEKRLEAVEKLNGESCTCGCNLSIAKCRIDDPECPVSLPRAQAIVAEIAKK